MAGGRRPSEPELQAGFFYRPTVFADVTREMRIVREEVFGPVLTIERFSTEDEAVALANDTTYGLAGAVWTADAGRAQRVAARLRHGTVWINDYNTYLPQAEWGGFKQSGHRPRARADRPRRVPRGQAHLAEHRARPDRLVRRLIDAGIGRRPGVRAPSPVCEEPRRYSAGISEWIASRSTPCCAAIQPSHDVEERRGPVEDAEEDDRVGVADADPVERVGQPE